MSSGTSVRFSVLLIALLLTGCAETTAGRMAAAQPEPRDLSVLREGTPRAVVVAQLGQPVWSGDVESKRLDLFEFKQGYSRGTKTTRVILHGLANIVTVGLWDIIGRPIEAIHSGTPMRIEVTYDETERVASSRALRPEDDLPMAPPARSR
jgi:hypothetical protein